MIVIKYMSSRLEGFQVNEFWFSSDSFSYMRDGAYSSVSIPLLGIREILVDGATIWQREAV